jgi:aerobic carbon-monoxide dehydrogenase small subunit
VTFTVAFNVNGTAHSLEVEPRRLLVHVLRDDLHLTGTHIGCDTGQCGACTVLVDELAAKSCNLLAVQADGAAITTVEGLATKGELNPLQRGFWEQHGLQCGFCTPGMIMTASDLLARNPDPSDAEIRHAIEGNYCRCTGYQNIVAAIRQAGQIMRGEEPVPIAVGAGDEEPLPPISEEQGAAPAGPVAEEQGATPSGTER